MIWEKEELGRIKGNSRHTKKYDQLHQTERARQRNKKKLCQYQAEPASVLSGEQLKRSPKPAGGSISALYQNEWEIAPKTDCAIKLKNMERK